MEQTPNTGAVDAFLMAQRAPAVTEPLIVDPQYGSIRLVTPIGRVGGVTLVSPRAAVVGKDPTFYLRLIFNPDSCNGASPDLMTAIYNVVMHRFPSENRGDPATGQSRAYTGWELFSVDEKSGGLWYPLQDGNSIFAKDPQKYAAYRNMKFINASKQAKNKQGESNQPVCFDANGAPMDPSKIYLGCYSRAVVTVFSYPKVGAQSAGTRGVGISLESVQFARHGERMASFDAVAAGRNAFASAGAIPVDPTAPQQAPAMAAPAGAPAGFAAPGPAAGTPGGFAAPFNPQAAPTQAGPGAVYQPQPQTQPGMAPPGAR